MKNSKKLLVIIPMVLLLITACGSKKDDAEKTDIKIKTETKTEVGKGENKYDAKTGVFKSDDGNFSVNFPKEPEFRADPVDLGEGRSTMMNSFAYVEDGKKVLMIAYSNVPVDGDFEIEDARTLLKEERGGALGSFGVEKPEEEKQSDYEENPGLFYKAKTPEGFYVAAQTYFIDNRLYQIEMLAAGNYPSQEEMEAFIGSFKLLK